jgi:hypothetical protein
MEKLIKLVTELKAPKNQFNGFGKYNYRNIEDIMEAAKPLLHKYGLKLTFVDYTKTVMMDGVENSVIYSTAIIKDSNNILIDKATGIAGVERRKGMDLAQTFGASTSYARKYAAGSLFNLDDTKDSDSMQKPKEAVKPTLTPNSDAFLKAVQFIKDGGEIADIEKKYSVSKDTRKLIAQKLSN